MPDFTKLYKKTPGEARRPPTMPGGTYKGIIRSYEMVEGREKKTPGVLYHLTLTEAPDSVPAEWKETDENGKVWEYTRSELNVTKRPQRFSFYFPVDDETGEVRENSMFYFDQFIRTLDIEFEGMGYDQLLPAPVGHQVLIDITQSLNQESGRIFSQVRNISGLK